MKSYKCFECNVEMRLRSCSGMTWMTKINGEIVTRYVPSYMKLMRCNKCNEAHFNPGDIERIEAAVQAQEKKNEWSERVHNRSVPLKAQMSKFKNMWDRSNAVVKKTRADLKKIAQDPRVRKAITVGHEAFNAAAPFIEKPSTWTAAKAAFNFAKTAIVDEIGEIYHYDYFEDDEWSTLFGAEFTYNVYAVVNDYPFESVKVADEKLEIRLIEVDGVTVGWVHDTINNEINGNMHVHSYGAERVRNFVRGLLWTQYGNKSLVMQTRFTALSSRNEARTVFEVDDLVKALPSELADKLVSQTKRFFSKNYSRAYLLYGPPGTGKSTIARTVVDGLSLRSFRIRVEDVSRISKTTLFQAISVFQPDAIIFDDFDRAGSQAELLETLTLFKDKVKLVIATVNDVDRLDDALKRPERFDRHVLVDRMDEAVVKMMLGDFSDGYETVKDWPIVFINEYVKCRTVMTPEEAELEVADLARRVDGLENYRDEDDVSRMLSALKKKKGKSKKIATMDDEVHELLGTKPAVPKAKASVKKLLKKISDAEKEELDDEEEEEDEE